MNKKVLISLSLFFIITGCNHISPSPPAPRPGVQLVSQYSGGWNTDDDNRWTTLTVEPLESARFFYISNNETIDNVFHQYRIYSDQQMMVNPLNEGSSVLVQGRSIAIEQIDSGPSGFGEWSTLPAMPIDSDNINWQVNPNKNTDALVASFDEETEFVMNINRTSNGCTGTYMILVVDGETVNGPNNTALKLLEGSSIIGKGKVITIRANGTCNATGRVQGSMKIKKILPEL